jgi:hypothetical protein
MPKFSHPAGVLAKLSAAAVQSLGLNKPPHIVCDQLGRRRFMCLDCHHGGSRCPYFETRGCEGMCRVTSFDVEPVCQKCWHRDLILSFVRLKIPRELKDPTSKLYLPPKEESVMQAVRNQEKSKSGKVLAALNFKDFKWSEIADGVRGTKGRCRWATAGGGRRTRRSPHTTPLRRSAPPLVHLPALTCHSLHRQLEAFV